MSTFARGGGIDNETSFAEYAGSRQCISHATSRQSDQAAGNIYTELSPLKAEGGSKMANLCLRRSLN